MIIFGMAGEERVTDFFEVECGPAYLRNGRVTFDVKGVHELPFTKTHAGQISLAFARDRSGNWDFRQALPHCSHSCVSQYIHLEGNVELEKETA